VHQLRLYKTSLYFRGKDAMIKDFKLEILICLIDPSPNIEPHYTKHALSSPFLYRIDQFLALEERGGGYKCSFSFRRRGTMCEDVTSFEFLSVHSSAYLQHWQSSMRGISQVWPQVREESRKV